jgi:TRAP-type C4-dicarboxylate transport system permease large subunit
MVLGSVLEGIPAIVLIGPLLFPAARALGLHDVHYAMVVILAMGIGLLAPPFGLGFYTACAIGRVPPEAAMGRVWPPLRADNQRDLRKRSGLVFSRATIPFASRSS